VIQIYIFDHFNFDIKYLENNIFLEKMFQIKVVWFEEDNQMSYLDFGFRTYFGTYFDPTRP